jgi:signal recognition particle subunit SEC65
VGNSNFILKVTDAKLSDIQKALQAAGIKVRSIIEVFKEEGNPPLEEKEVK